MIAKVITVPRGLYMMGRPSVFLAGPIQDAPDWQSEVIEAMSDSMLTFYNPRTPDPRHGDYAAPQVNWESEYLYAATVVMFWLANPEHTPREGCSYAQTSRFELGEWFARAGESDRVRLVVGAEPGFPGSRYIRTRRAERSAVKVRSTLEECIQDLKDITGPLCRLASMESRMR